MDLLNEFFCLAQDFQGAGEIIQNQKESRQAGLDEGGQFLISNLFRQLQRLIQISFGFLVIPRLKICQAHVLFDPSDPLLKIYLL